MKTGRQRTNDTATQERPSYVPPTDPDAPLDDIEQAIVNAIVPGIVEEIRSALTKVRREAEREIANKPEAHRRAPRPQSG